MVRKHVPDRGDIYHLNFAPSAGREQRGPHYGVVVSPRAFNAVSSLPFVAPVTTVGNASRMAGFAVSLQGSGLGVTGVVQVDQIRALDLVARGATPTGERLPDFLIEDIVARLSAILLDE